MALILVAGHSKKHHSFRKSYLFSYGICYHIVVYRVLYRGGALGSPPSLSSVVPIYNIIIGLQQPSGAQ